MIFSPFSKEYCFNRTVRPCRLAQSNETNWCSYDGWQQKDPYKKDGNGGLDLVRVQIDGPGIDEHLGFVRNEGSSSQPLWKRYTLVQGHLGHVMKEVNEQGNIVEQYEYDRFGGRSIYDGAGNALSVSAYGVNGFQGRRHDAETGLMYFRNRSYYPHLGRFLTVDPIGVWGDGGNWGNGFGFVHGSPTSFSDDLGLETIVIVGSSFSPEDFKDYSEIGRRVIAGDKDGGLLITYDPKTGKRKVKKIKYNPKSSKKTKKAAPKSGKKRILIFMHGIRPKRKKQIPPRTLPGPAGEVGLPGKKRKKLSVEELDFLSLVEKAAKDKKLDPKKPVEVVVCWGGKKGGTADRARQAGKGCSVRGVKGLGVADPETGEVRNYPDMSLPEPSPPLPNESGNPSSVTNPASRPTPGKGK